MDSTGVEYMSRRDGLKQLPRLAIPGERKGGRRSVAEAEGERASALCWTGSRYEAEVVVVVNVVVVVDVVVVVNVNVAMVEGGE